MDDKHPYLATHRDTMSTDMIDGSDRARSWRERFFRKEKRHSFKQSELDKLDHGQPLLSNELVAFNRRSTGGLFKTGLIKSQEENDVEDAIGELRKEDIEDDVDEEEDDEFCHGTQTRQSSSTGSVDRKMHRLKLLTTVELNKETDDHQTKTENDMEVGSNLLDLQKRSVTKRFSRKPPTPTNFDLRKNLEGHSVGNEAFLSTASHGKLRHNFSPRRWRSNARSSSPSRRRKRASSSASTAVLDEEQETGPQDEGAPVFSNEKTGKVDRSRSRYQQSRRCFSFSPSRRSRSSFKPIIPTTITNNKVGRETSTDPSLTPATLIIPRSTTSPSLQTRSLPIIGLTRITSVSTQATIKASNSKENLDVSSQDKLSEKLELSEQQQGSSSPHHQPYIHQHHRGHRKKRSSASPQHPPPDVWSTLLHNVMKGKIEADNVQNDFDHRHSSKNCLNLSSSAHQTISKPPLSSFYSSFEYDTCSSSTPSSSSTPVSNVSPRSPDVLASISSLCVANSSSAGPSATPFSSSKRPQGKSAFLECGRHASLDTLSERAACTARGTNNIVRGSTVSFSTTRRSTGSSPVRSLAALLEDVRHEKIHTPSPWAQTDHKGVEAKNINDANGNNEPRLVDPTIYRPNSWELAVPHSLPSPSTRFAAKSAGTSSTRDNAPTSSGDEFHRWLSTVRCASFAAAHGDENGEARFSTTMIRKKPKCREIILEPSYSSSSLSWYSEDDSDPRPNNEDINRSKGQGVGAVKYPNNNNTNKSSVETDSSASPMWTSWVDCGSLPIPTKKKWYGDRGDDGGGHSDLALIATYPLVTSDEETRKKRLERA